tara:strand:+ start:312 stop:497 length:186 start_codon:yes stop_codon:yes gene_type:complete
MSSFMKVFLKLMAGVTTWFAVLALVGVLFGEHGLGLLFLASLVTGVVALAASVIVEVGEHK